MPELPEVETVRSDIAPFLQGRTVRAVSVTRDRAVRRQPHADFIAGLRGRTIGAVHRHGKYLFADLGDDALVVHLRMSGQVRIAEPKDEMVKHTHVVIDLDNKTQLRFVDPRTFGEMFVDPLEGDRPQSLRGLGPDAMGRLSSAEFHALLAKRSIAIKAALLDQNLIAGIGNLYADEALFAAKVHPKRLASSVSGEEAAEIHRHVRRIMKAAIAARGSSFKDEGYVDAFGRPGSFAAKHKVYGQPGKPCPRCATPIEKTVVAQRGTHFCPSCQCSPTVRVSRRPAR